MIGASSELRPNQPELSKTSRTAPDVATSKPATSQTQCSAFPLRSKIAGHEGSPSVSARMTQIRYGKARTTITSTANNGSNDKSVRRPHAVATANPAISSNRPIPAEVVSNNSPASIDHANQALRRFCPINCQECNRSRAQSGRASTSGPNSSLGELNPVRVSVTNPAATACSCPTTARASRYKLQRVPTEQSCARRYPPKPGLP